MIKPSERAPLYLFSHIPKTGGTTLARLFQESLGLAYVPAIRRSDSAHYRAADLGLDLRLNPWARCVGGHSIKPFEDLSQHGVELRWFTVLREPKARFLSHYRHQYERGHDRYHLALDEWCLAYRRRNWMTRMIAGEENLDRAKDILNRFHIVGTLDNLDVVVEELRREPALHRLKPLGGRRENVAASRQKTEQLEIQTSHYEELIVEQNALDIELYEYVRDELDPVRRSGGPGRTPTNTWTGNRYLARGYRNVVHKPAVRVVSRVTSVRGR